MEACDGQGGLLGAGVFDLRATAPVMSEGVQVSIQRRVMVLALVVWPASAFAYVDPGSGMLIWQGVLAAVGAVIVSVRKPMEVIRRVLQRFRKKQ